jgi:hypothetical protein
VRNPLPLLSPLLLLGCAAVWEPVDGTLGQTASDCLSEDHIPFYADTDGDGFGDPQEHTRRGCAPEDGEVANALDCDDTDDAVHPDAEELCNDMDDDCDGSRDGDDAIDATDWYLDGDGDGYGDGDSAFRACTPPNPGYVTQDGDCDDGEASTYPDAPEQCDGEDNDCDGEVDESPVDGLTFYTDADGDGFGVTDAPLTSCELPAGASAEGGDCQDEGADAASVFPGSTFTEVPFDGVDADCDGIDECTDLDCNGTPDVVVANYRRTNLSSYSTPTVVFLDGGLGETLSLSFTAVTAIRAADLNLDGYPDLVVATETSGSAVETDSAIRWGDPADEADRFDVQTLLPTSSARDVEVADLNADGWPDLVFANHHDDEGDLDIDSSVYWGSEDGFDTSDRTDLPTHGAVDVLVADIDGDGASDLVFCNEREGSMQAEDEPWLASSVVYWNTASATAFQSAQRTLFETVGCASVKADDANGDGVLDLFFAQPQDGLGEPMESVAYLSASGESRHQTSPTTIIPVEQAICIQPSDVSDDGSLDVIGFTWPIDEEEGPWDLDGRAMYGTSPTEPTWPTGGSKVLTAYGAGHGLVTDVSGDGIDDVILPGFRTDGGDTEPGSVIWFGRSGGLTTAATLTLMTPNARSVTAADLNGDGLMDLIFVGSSDVDERAGLAIYMAQDTPSPDGGYPSTDALMLAGAQITRTAPLVVGTPSVSGH